MQIRKYVTVCTSWVQNTPAKRKTESAAEMHMLICEWRLGTESEDKEQFCSIEIKQREE